MSGEPAATPAATPSESVSPERAGAPAPVDGGQPGANAPANGEQQPPQGADGQQPNDDGQGGKSTPEHRTVTGRISHYQKETAREREARIRAEARAETLERILRDGGPRQPEPQAQPAPQAPEAPDPSKYRGGKFDEQYVEDFAAWKAERAVEAALEKRDNDAKERQRAEAANAVIEQGRQRLETTLSAAVAEADGANGDHFQNAPRVLDLAFVPVREGGLPRHVVDLITESDNPVHVAEVLGRQPDRLAALRQMNPIQAAKHLGALDAQIGANLKRLAAQPAPAQRAPQPAPAPMPTVPHGGASLSFNPETATPKEWDDHLARVRARAGRA